jgi:pimeloyl-ACP methyl ester carboxylesterase
MDFDKVKLFKIIIDNDSIELAYKEFFPEDKDYSKEKAIIFLPGWNVKAEDTIINQLCKSYSDNSKERTIVITSRVEKVVKDSLFKQAKAIKEYILNEGLKEITIIGFSEGGSKGIDLTVLLQEKIKINGLILLDPVGIHDQGAVELATKFAKDSLIHTFPANLSEQAKTSIKQRKTLTGKEIAQNFWDSTKSTVQLGSTIIKNMAKEAKDVGIRQYPKRFKHQVREMARKNPRVERVKVPVVLMTGAKDPVSAKEKIISKKEEEKLTKEYLKELKISSRLDPAMHIREKYLKENLFLQSPQIRAIFAKKYGHHGLPLFRPEQVAKVSLYLLKRPQRVAKR